MGALVSQKIPTWFGGVSKQPASVRRPGQVAEMDNALPSVVSGGFEKRPATQHIADLTASLNVANEYRVHMIDRDPTEQYVVLVGGSSIKVFDAITGAAKTVNYRDTRMIVAQENDISATGVSDKHFGDDTAKVRLFLGSAETTVTWNWTSDGGTSYKFKIEGSADGTTWNDLATGLDGNTGTTTTTIGAVVPGDHNFVRINITEAGSASQNLNVTADFLSNHYLQGADAEDIAMLSIADFTFVVNRNMVVQQGVVDTNVLDSSVQTFSELPETPDSGDIVKVLGSDADAFLSYFVRYDGTNWSETAEPGGTHTIAEQTMPYVLVRQADGTFTFGPGDPNGTAGDRWRSRLAGDSNTAPAPSFIDEAIQDVKFFRGRLAAIAGENINLSTVLDPFDFWPESVTQVTDEDPIDRSASTSRVTLLKWAAVFRKFLFSTSANAQFELSGADAQLTPSNAALDLSTTYTASLVAPPEAVGDVLYFASTNTRAALLQEYYFNESTLSNTAADVTKHVVDYIPTEIVQMAGDPSTNTLFVLSSGESNSLFVYRTFFDGVEKLQSAWARYIFGGGNQSINVVNDDDNVINDTDNVVQGETEISCFIHGIGVLSGFLVMVVERPTPSGSKILLEQMPIEREVADSSLGFAPLLDQRVIVTGVYSAVTDKTTWTLPYSNGDDVVVILGGGFDEAGRLISDLDYSTDLAVIAEGDFSDDECYLGRPYTMDVEPSTIFFRESDGSAVQNGRLQLKDITIRFADSGYFKVEVTPHLRDTFTYEFTGRIVGSASNIIGQWGIEEQGSFTAPIQTRSDTVLIRIKNDQPVPSVINSAEWRGFFNELSRQE